MSDTIKTKTITRTYRNGQSAFQMEFEIYIKPNICGDKFIVFEQRRRFKDEKRLFTGKTLDEAISYYNSVESCTYKNGKLTNEK